MKIAIIGIRGVPLIYSGFESFVENFMPFLSKKGYKIFVYNRSTYFKDKIKNYKGINLIYLPCIRNKYFETLSHSFLSTLHSIFILKPDIIYFFNLGNAPLILLANIFKIKVIFNPDGFDWKRKKWNFFGKIYLKFCENILARYCNFIIADSPLIENYYWKRYRKKTFYIPYPFVNNFKFNEEVLKRLNLEKNKYFLWVGRITPDNYLEELIEAFKKVKIDYKCVIVGDNFYDLDYKKYILNLAKEDKRIIFTGFLNRNDYGTLLKNSYCYIETKRSGGTHPSFIEAIFLVRFIVINSKMRFFLKNINHNLVLIYKNKKELKKKLLEIVNVEEYKITKKFELKRKSHTKLFYNPKLIIDKYINLIRNILT